MNPYENGFRMYDHEESSPMDRRKFFHVAELTIGMLIPRALIRQSRFVIQPESGLFLPHQTELQLTDENTIFLTIDDGYVRLAEKIAALNALGVRGTFFLTGQVIYTYPNEVQLLVDSNHSLKNHTYDHATLTRLSFEDIMYEIDLCEQAAQETVGVSTKPYIRPPGGALNSTVRNAASGLGYTTILWNWDTRDWAGTSASYIERNIGRGVVLMHTQGINTVAALNDVIPQLQDQGYNFAIL